MADESVLLTGPEISPRVRVRTAAAPDALFRLRLEAGLAAGYRLAAVILGDRREAEDVTHDAIERAWRSRASLREIDRFEAWFQRIIVNACRDRMRRRRSAPTFVPVDGVEARSFRAAMARVPDPSSGVVEHDAMVRALARLNVDQRVAVVMRFYLDLEIDEIARRLGTRSGTIKSRLHRALRQLRTEWEEQR